MSHNYCRHSSWKGIPFDGCAQSSSRGCTDNQPTCIHWLNTVCTFYILWHVATLTSALKHLTSASLTYFKTHRQSQGYSTGSISSSTDLKLVASLQTFQHNGQYLLNAQQDLKASQGKGQNILTILTWMPCWNDNNFLFLFALYFGCGFHLCITVMSHL